MAKRNSTAAAGPFDGLPRERCRFLVHLVEGARGALVGLALDFEGWVGSPFPKG
jgi:hypothetical protein